MIYMKFQVDYNKKELSVLIKGMNKFHKSGFTTESERRIARILGEQFEYMYKEIEQPEKDTVSCMFCSGVGKLKEGETVLNLIITEEGFINIKVR